MSKKKLNFYVVWRGRVPGIYESWEECKEQVDGFPNADYKGFKTKQEAEEAYHNREITEIPSNYIEDSISVDAAWNNVTKAVEFQAVKTKTKEKIFKRGPYEGGTINIGEFLALVLALAYCKQIEDLDIPVYSDSQTAMKWVKDKKINSGLFETSENKELFDMIRKAEKFLHENEYTNPVLKWETQFWGEIPADYNRK